MREELFPNAGNYLGNHSSHDLIQKWSFSSIKHFFCKYFHLSYKHQSKVTSTKQFHIDKNTYGNFHTFNAIFSIISECLKTLAHSHSFYTPYIFFSNCCTIEMWLNTKTVLMTSLTVYVYCDRMKSHLILPPKPKKKISELISLPQH